MIVKFGVVNLLINNKSFCGLKTVELSQRQKCWTKQWVYVRGLCKAKSLVCPKPTAKNQKQPPWPGDLTPTPPNLRRAHPPEKFKCLLHLIKRLLHICNPH